MGRLVSIYEAQSAYNQNIEFKLLSLVLTIVELSNQRHFTSIEWLKSL